MSRKINRILGKIEYFFGYGLACYGLIRLNPFIACIVFGIIAMFMGAERQIENEDKSNEEGAE